jgi:hypothetical protein
MAKIMVYAESGIALPLIVIPQSDLDIQQNANHDCSERAFLHKVGSHCTTSTNAAKNALASDSSTYMRA